MVFMVYGSVDLVRKFSGLTTNEFSDAEILVVIASADVWLDGFTQVTWIPTDDFYPLVQVASSLYAAGLLVGGLAKGESKSLVLKKAAENVLAPLFVDAFTVGSA